MRFFLVSASVVWSVAHDPVFLGKSSRTHYICLLQKVTTSAMSLLSQVIVTQHGDVRAHHKRNGTLFCNLIHCIKGATLPLIPFTLSKGNLRWQICFGLEKTQKNKPTICFRNSKKKKNCRISFEASLRKKEEKESERDDGVDVTVSHHSFPSSSLILSYILLLLLKARVHLLARTWCTALFSFLP